MEDRTVDDWADKLDETSQISVSCNRGYHAEIRRLSIRIGHGYGSSFSEAVTNAIQDAIARDEE